MSVNHHAAMDIDPRRLVLEKNVRSDATADAALVESIRTRGVLQPIVVTEPEPERFVVLAGHRRTLAAIEAGLRQVPITVVQTRTDADHILDQLAENDHRAALRDLDRMAGYEELTLFGMSVEEIAAAAVVPVSEVEAGLKVAASETVRDLAAELPLDLEQLAAMAEFEGDEDAMSDLADAAADGRFAHVLRTLQRQRSEEASIATTTRELEAAGRAVVPWPSGSYEPTNKVVTIDYLDGVGEKNHAKCPGRAVAIRATWEWADGYGSTQELRIHTAEACTDWKANGHKHRYSRTVDVDQSDEDREAKAQERREVVERNKAWPIATEVRRDWLKAYFAAKLQKRPGQTVTLWVGQRLIDGGMAFGGSHSASTLFTEWTGEETSWRAKKKLAASTSQARVDQLLHAMSLAACESHLSAKDGWRSTTDVAAYLRHLESLGYMLSDVERFAAGYPVEGGEES